MKDLGVKKSEYYGSVVCSSDSEKEQEDKIIYPDITLRGTQLEGLGLPEDIAINGEYEGKVKLKVSSANNKSDKTITFDVISLELGESEDEDLAKPKVKTPKTISAKKAGLLD